MKILFISWDLPPSGKGSAVIVNNLIINNPNLFFLYGEKKSYKTDYINTHYEIQAFDNSFLGFNSGYRYYRWLNFLSCMNELKKLHSKRNFDAVLCVFPNDFFLQISYSFSRKYNLPLYVWFHNLYFENMRGFGKIHANFLEKKIFNYSKKIFGMSDGVTNFYKKKYTNHKSKIFTLQHGFQLDDVNRINNYVNSNIINFSYTGSFHETCEDSTLRMCRVILSNFNCVLHVFGGNNKNKFIEHNICGDNVIFYDFMSEESFSKKLKTMQIHLLPHGFYNSKFSKQEIDTIFSTRLIPLLCSGIPILSNTPKEAFFTKFLKENNCSYVVETKVEDDIILGVKRILNDKKYRSKIVNNGYKVVDYFDVNLTSKKLISYLS